MGYLRPLQAVQKPTTFDIDPLEAFERGSYLWVTALGTVTTVYASAVAPLGLADDEQDTSLTAKIVGATFTATAITSSTTGATFSGSVGSKTILSPTSGADSIFTKVTSARLFWLNGTTWTALVSGAVATYGTVTNVTLNLAANANYTVAVTGTGLITGAQQYKIVFDYTYLRQQDGAELVSDMFGNKSTSGLQTGAANSNKKVTVWFMDGIYETDQYDPLVSYTMGAPVYAKDGGVITSVSTSATQIGIILKAPAANWSPETKTTLGHTQPKPESLRILLKNVQSK